MPHSPADATHPHWSAPFTFMLVDMALLILQISGHAAINHPHSPSTPFSAYASLLSSKIVPVRHVVPVMAGVLVYTALFLPALTPAAMEPKHSTEHVRDLLGMNHVHESGMQWHYIGLGGCLLLLSLVIIPASKAAGQWACRVGAMLEHLDCSSQANKRQRVGEPDMEWAGMESDPQPSLTHLNF
jgi:hypothetical protein